MRDRLGYARLEIGKACFIVLVFRHFAAGQARGRALGVVGGDLHLPGQGEHVGGQPRGQKHLRVDLAVKRVLFGCRQNIGKGFQPG